MSTSATMPQKAPLARCSGHFAPDPVETAPSASAFAPASAPMAASAFAPSASAFAPAHNGYRIAVPAADPDDYGASMLRAAVADLYDIVRPLTIRAEGDEIGQCARLLRGMLWMIGDEGAERGVAAARALAASMAEEGWALLHRLADALVPLSGRELEAAGLAALDLLPQPPAPIAAAPVSKAPAPAAFAPARPTAQPVDGGQLTLA